MFPEILHSMWKWCVLPLMETETVQLPDPAEHRTLQQLRPSTSAYIKNTSMYFLPQGKPARHYIREAATSSKSSTEVRSLFCRWVISGFCMAPQTRTTLLTQSECLGDMDTSPAWLCWSEGTAHGLSWLTREGMQQQGQLHTKPHCVVGVLSWSSLKHQVILSNRNQVVLWLWHKC